MNFLMPLRRARRVRPFPWGVPLLVALAVILDNFGATVTSEIVRMSVNPKPFVEVTAPANGALLQEGADIEINATAVSAVGPIDRVEFFNGTNSLGASPTPPYRVALGNAAAGVYELTARATSAFGVVATSAPVIVTVNARPVVALFRTSFFYAEDDGPVLLDDAAMVSDADSMNFDAGTLRVEFVANGVPEDRLAIRNQGANAGRIFTSGSLVSYDSLPLGSFEGGTNGSSPLVIRFGGKATAVGVTALLRNLTYENASSQPSSLPRVVRLVLNDGDGGNSAPVFITVEDLTPGMGMEGILLLLVDSELSRNRIRPLLATIEAAMASFERGNFTSSANQLRAFQNMIRAQVALSDSALASSLNQAVQRILDTIGR